MQIMRSLILTLLIMALAVGPVMGQPSVTKSAISTNTPRADGSAAQTGDLITRTATAWKAAAPAAAPKFVTYTTTATAKDVVYMTATGTAARAKADAIATMYAIGFATETKTAAACVIQTAGVITITGKTFTTGLPVFVSPTTAGDCTQSLLTAGQFAQVIGIAVDDGGGATTENVQIQIGPVVEVGSGVATVAEGGTGLSTIAANAYIKGNDASNVVPRTYAEVKQDLSLNNVDNTSNVTERAAVATLTNKRINPRIKTLPYNDATITVGETTDYNTDLADQFIIITGLAQDTLLGAPGGTPVDGQKLTFRILCDGSARTLTWNAVFVARGASLPGAITASKYIYIGFVYNSVTSTWDCVATAQES